jgi:glycosyltransferase involved in cell wall biosynthesis
MPAKLVFAASDQPEISVVIPSFDGKRGGNVDLLLGDLRGQTFKSIEVILSIGESPNGHARNVGCEIARGKYLVFIDDDVTLGDEHVLQNIIEPLDNREDIGMTGPSQQIPLDAKWFQRWSSKQVPRSLSTIVDEITDSDMVSHMCLAIPRDLFERIGREGDWLLAGTDPDLRYRVRQAGYRIVVVPRTWAYHPAPESMKSLLEFGYKKGRYTAWQYRFARDLMYDAPDGHTGEFKAQTTLAYRVLRKVGRMCAELVSLRPLGLIFDAAYVVGYVHGLIRRWS